MRNALPRITALSIWKASSVQFVCLLRNWLRAKREMVRPRRFELLTYSFGGCRSIQLSYGRMR